MLKPNGIAFISVSASKHRRKNPRFYMYDKAKLVAPRTYVPLNGDEKGLPHFIYNKEIMKSAYEGELSYELSSRRTIENEIRREQILDFVSRCYNRDIEEIKAKEPGTLEARKFAVYLLRKTTGLKLQKIGEMFGISYKGVYWLYRSFNEQKNKSRKIKKYLKRFEKLSN